MNSNKKTLGKSLGWIFGVILALVGFMGLIASDFIPGLVMVVMGLALLPPIGELFENKWNIKLTKVKKSIILVVGFLIFGISIGSSDTVKNESPAAKQEAASEEKSQEQPQVEVAASEETSQIEPVATEQVDSDKKFYPVKKVVDGDTVQVTIDGKDEVLRLIGINTPETVDPRKPVECFGAEASAKAKEVLMGKNVSLEADETQSNRDKYNRLLRYAYLEDGTNFNKMMIEEGYAHEYTYDTSYKYQADFKQAQQEAKNAKRGLWAENTCNGQLNKPTNGDVDNTTTKTDSSTSQNIQTKTETTNTGGSFTCAGKTKCGQMTSCAEAKFYLHNCGVSRLDGDKDGVPCETLCN